MVNISTKVFELYGWGNSTINNYSRMNDKLWGDYGKLMGSQKGLIDIAKILMQCSAKDLSVWHAVDRLERLSLASNKGMETSELGLNITAGIAPEVKAAENIKNMIDKRKAVTAELNKMSLESGKFWNSQASNLATPLIKASTSWSAGIYNDILNSQKMLSNRAKSMLLESAKDWTTQRMKLGASLKKMTYVELLKFNKSSVEFQKSIFSSEKTRLIRGINDIVKDNSTIRMNNFFGANLKQQKAFSDLKKLSLDEKLLKEAVKSINSDFKVILDKYSEDNITFDKKMFSSLSDKEQITNLLSESLDELVYAKEVSYSLMPHQLVLLEKIINAYKSNNYFYIPFIAFSLIDSLFNDIVCEIERVIKQIEGIIYIDKSRGKQPKVTNFLYNFDFNMGDMEQMEIYSLLKVYQNLYSSYSENIYSGACNRHAIMHGAWEEVDKINKLDVLKLMQFVFVLEKNINNIYALLKSDKNLRITQKKTVIPN